MEKEYIITIYTGPVIKLPVLGRERLFKEREFPAEMVGQEYARDVTNLPETAPGYDFYMLTDQQFSEYLDFRKLLRDEAEHRD